MEQGDPEDQEVADIMSKNNSGFFNDFFELKHLGGEQPTKRKGWRLFARAVENVINTKFVGFTLYQMRHDPLPIPRYDEYTKSCNMPWYATFFIFISYSS